MKTSLQIPRHFLASLIVLAGAQANGADLYWDTDGDTTAATGGTGAWNLTDNFWRDGSAAGTLAPWTNGNVAQLAGTYGTLTIPASTAITVNQIHVLSDTTGTAPYTIATANATTGTLTFVGPNKRIEVPAGLSLRINPTIFQTTLAGESNLLTVQGGGTTLIGGANRAYRGGPLKVSGSGTILELLGTNSLHADAFGGMPLTADQGTTVRLNGTSNTTTNTVLSGATLVINNSTPNGLVLQGNGSITAGGLARNSIVGAAAAGLKSLITANAAVRFIAVNPTGDPSGFDLELSATSGELALVGNGANNGSFQKNGAGVMRLMPNTYISSNRDKSFDYAKTSLIVNGGVLQNESAIHSRTEIRNGAVARTGTSSGTYDAVHVVGTGVFEFSRTTGTFATGLTFGEDQNTITLNNGGTLKYVGVNTDLSPLLNTLNGSGGTIDTNTQNVTFANALSGTGGLTKSGTGTLTLGAVNTYFGLTSVKGGTLALGAAASIEDGSGIHVGSGASIDLSALTAPTYTIGGAFPQTLSGSGTVIATGKTVVLGSSAQLSPGDTAGTLQVDLGSGTFDLSAATDLVFQVGATSDRLLVPAGTLNIGSGTLGFSDFTFSSSGGLASGTYVLLESTDLTGTLDPADLAGTFGPFSGSLSIVGDNVVLTVVASPFDTFMETFSGQIPNALDRGPTADPDNDGADNLTEFAVKGNPADGSNNGLLAVLVHDTDTPADTPELTLIAAVRRDAEFSANANNAQQATEDGVTYAVEGSLNLDLWTSPVSAIATGSNTAPAASGLTEDLTGTDWEYRTFSLDASEGLSARGFLRVQFSQ